MSSPTRATEAPAAPPAQDLPEERIEAVPVRHLGRLAAAVLALLAVGGTVWSLAKNPNLHWDVVAGHLFDTTVLDGLLTTAWLTAAAMAVGVAGGVVLAVMRLSPNPVLYGLSSLFVWLFRGTPLLVQIIFWGFFGALYKHVMIGIPFTHVTFASWPTNSVIGATTAALLALGLNEAAYASEIVRAGIQSVDPGQAEAAHSLGMSPALTMRRIVLPQAMRVIIPPMGNETINMLKTTALVSVISAHEMLFAVQEIYAQNYQVIPLLVVASFWYLALTTVLGIPQAWLERRYGRGTSARPSALRRLLGADLSLAGLRRTLPVTDRPKDSA
ncbi:ABC transporter permease [Kitasatospora sp. MMS16-BH015]|uniref:amino acid ABC transporter permease n=1 Tax=Kitasatospora sp. MMS16-BH015 TaxID=2018025 RepID=UPI000CA3E80F|nr:amino acid ABC transporter permease [Kitasatospora sp. MMS16-BH015]AUG75887.1 ABC transporter permease [Kitasatospora sp. MMS16-BH015]